MYKRTTNVLSVCKPAFAGAAMLAASSGFATETILVNELGGAGVDQVAPIIASTSHGSLVIFEDCRSGRDSNYRARAMDANGGAYGSSVSLHAILTGFEDISQLSLDGNETGEAVLLWKEQDLDGRRVVRLDPATGEAIGYVQTILEDEPNLTNYSTATITLFDDGSSMVLFNAGVQLRGRLYSAGMVPLGPSFLIDELVDGNNAEVGLHADGSFTIAWTGIAVEYFHIIRTQRFNANGTPAGDVHDHTSEHTFFGSIALGTRADGTGVVAWATQMNEYEIRAQAIDAYGEPVGEMFTLVNEASFISGPGGLWACADGSWALVQDQSNMNLSRAVDLFDETFTRIGNQEMVLTGASPSSVWMSADESILMCWETQLVDQKDIVGTLVSTNGLGSSDTMMLADDVDGADQYRQALATNLDGRSVVVWTDERNGHMQAYMQYYDADGNPVGMNRYVADIDAWGYSSIIRSNQPDVAMNESGEVVVLWSILDGDTPGFMAQRFDAEGNVSGYPINVTAGSPSPIAEADIALFEDGGFVVAWDAEADDPSSFSDDLNIYVRSFDPAGNALQAVAPRVNSLVNGQVDHLLFGLVARSDSSALVAYSADPSYQVPAARLIYAREINPDGSLGGTQALTNAEDHVYWAAFGGNDDGFTIAWSGFWDDGVTVRHFDANGDLLHADFLLGNYGDAHAIDVSFGRDGSRYLFFEDYQYINSSEGASYHWKVRRYDAGGARDGSDELVLSMENETYQWEDPEGAIAGNRFVMAYSEASGTDQGWDIRMSWIDVEVCLVGDYNCDGQINGQDLAHLLGYWGLAGGDLNGDGTTDGSDLAQLLGSWTE